MTNDNSPINKQVEKLSFYALDIFNANELSLIEIRDSLAFIDGNQPNKLK